MFSDWWRREVASLLFSTNRELMVEATDGNIEGEGRDGGNLETLSGSNVIDLYMSAILCSEEAAAEVLMEQGRNDSV